MWYFIILYLLVFLLLYISKKRPTLEGVCYCIIILLLSIFSGLRVGVGRDYMMYQTSFVNPLDQSNDYFEKSWIIISYVFRLLHLGFHDWLFILSFITVSLMYYGAKRLKIDLFWFTILYVFVTFGYVTSMNLVRQFFAVAIVFAAAHNIFEGRKLRFFLAILIASIFHRTALFSIIVFPIMWQRWNYILLVLSLVVSFVIGDILCKPLLMFLSVLMPQRYSMYLDPHNFGAVVSTGFYRYFLNAVSIVLIYTLRKYKEDKNGIRSISTNIVVLSICIYNIMYNFNDGIRLIYYFIPFVFVIIPIYINGEYKTSTKMIYSLILIGFVLFGLKVIFDPVEPYFNYRTMFENYNPNNKWI